MRPDRAPAAAATGSVNRTRRRSRNNGDAPLPRYLVERLLLDTTGYLEDVIVGNDAPGLSGAIGEARTRLAAAGCQVPAIEAVARYGWVNETLSGIVTRPSTPRDVQRSARPRAHAPYLGVPDLPVDDGRGFSSGLLVGRAGAGSDRDGRRSSAQFAEEHMAEGALRSLLVDGLIGGVGGVLAFLPQIFILFFFIPLLEDCGYMARAAYLMDKLMVRVRPERKIVHSAVVVIRLRNSRHHGHAHDREPTRPFDHDSDRPVDEL